MNKLQRRRRFVKQTIENPDRSIKELREYASDVKKCTKTGEKVNLLSRLLHVSQRTIWDDYTKD